jgi:Na+-driven multidrug efflux pump
VGLSTVLYEAARSVNRPEIPSYAELAGLAVTVALLAALLKTDGIIGAAIASTAAYAFTLAFMLGYLLLKGSRESGA